MQHNNILILLVLCSALLVCYTAPTCRFAKYYTLSDLMSNHYKRDDFIESVADWESHFHMNGVGINEASGLTYDGTQIDYMTGLAHAPLHDFTASSKESLHVNLLALALRGDKNAQRFINMGVDGAAAITRALTLCAKKIASYEAFNSRYPGFGGFLPWFKVADSGIVVFTEQMWKDHVPGLDNGQLIWGMVALAKELEAYDATLAGRYKSYLEIMRKNILTIFYEGDGKVRALATIRNVTAQPFKDNYWNDAPDYLLDDPYEGELFAIYMDLYADWKSAGYDENERDKIWIFKRAKLQKASYTVDETRKITVEKGYWHSSHEKWKYLVLPYTSVPINQRVFMNGERARTHFSAKNKIPGFFASVTQVTTKGNYNVDYISACGIQEIASQPVLYHTTVTPYAAFPVILANQSVGITWYHLMISAPSMQGPYGSTEAINVTGTAIAPVATWDSKITTLVSMLGGISKITEEVMKKDEVFNRFYTVIDREWSRVFDRLEGEDIPFSLPLGLSIKSDFGDFITCNI